MPFRYLLRGVGRLLVICVSGAAQAGAITSGEYFPLADGNLWTYQIDGVETETVIVSPGVTLIDGVATKGLKDLSDGSIGYWTSDENGVREHRAFLPDVDVANAPPTSGTLTLTPPLVHARATTDLSEVVNTSGTVLFSYPGISPTPFLVNYTGSALVEAFETITVPAGTFKTLRSRRTVRAFGNVLGSTIDETGTSTRWDARFIGRVKSVATNPDGTETRVLTSTNIIPPIFSSTLPSSRSAQVNSPVTAFATILNPSGATAINCSISLVTSLPGTFLYQSTDPLTNVLTGVPNTPVTIPPDSGQSFVIAFTPSVAFPPTEVEFQYDCSSTDAAPTFVGLNTLLLSASNAQTPDVVALAATLSGDGIANVAGTAGTGIFGVAVANVGSTGLITASADTGGAVLPVGVSICETNPLTGECISPVASVIETTIDASDTGTFAIFLQGTGNIAFDPAANRVFVRFRDDSGATRGATSVALRTL